MIQGNTFHGPANIRGIFTDIIFLNQIFLIL